METNIHIKTDMISMSYKILKCKICNHLVHVHKKGSKYLIKNACEHIKVDGTISERDFHKYFHRGGYHG